MDAKNRPFFLVGRNIALDILFHRTTYWNPSKPNILKR
jgi:hypothetical protein